MKGDALVNKSSKASVLRGPYRMHSTFIVSTLLLSHVSRLLWETASLVLSSLAFWMLQHETKKCVRLFLTFFITGNCSTYSKAVRQLRETHILPPSFNSHQVVAFLFALPTSQIVYHFIHESFQSVSKEVIVEHV